MKPTIIAQSLMAAFGITKRQAYFHIAPVIAERNGKRYIARWRPIWHS